MNESFFSDLIQNISLLLVFSLLYGQKWLSDLNNKRLSPKIYSGIIVGIIGISLIYAPWNYVSGIVFDTRSILLAISGLFLGLIPTIIAILFTTIFRLFIGGDGVIMGIAVILSSGTIGLLWRHYLKKYTEVKPVISLLMLGYTVHIVMLACTVFLPEKQSLPILKLIWLPALTIYPFGTMLLGVIMYNQYTNWQNRKAKEFLDEYERRFVDMMTNIQMLSVIIDTNKKITFCNKYLLDITGYTYEEVIGQNWFDFFIPPDEKNKIDNVFVNLLDGDSNFYHFENVIITKQNVRLTISWNNTKLRDDKGNIIGLASIGENISEKKIVLENLRKSEDKFNTLFHSSPDAITLVKFSDRLIIEVNDSASTLTGYSRNELLGKNILSDFFWYNDTELYKYSELIATQKKVNNFEAQFKMKSGEIKTGLVSGEVIQIQDEQYVIGVIRDITKRKVAENKLFEKNKELENSINLLKQLNSELNLAKEKAEESNLLKTVFLQNISHEIRTPMNSILGFLSLLKDPSKDLNTKNNYINIINKSGKRLLRTVNDLIEISKIETNQITVNKSAVNINILMDEFYNLYNTPAIEKGLSFYLNKNNSEKNIIINTDKQLLDSIISNLISNALKFTNKGYIEFGGSLDQNSITFYVKDTGIGIPKNRLDAIFERFVQANLDISRDHEGSGIGLSIVKAYTTILGGRIWVESKLDEGSTFYVEIPVELTVQNEEKKEALKEQEIGITKDCKILVAEDDEVSYLYLENILDLEKITLIHVTNGLEAIEKVKNDSELSIVLMDVKMPKFNGVEATKKIREFNKSIPIIAQTAYAMEHDKDKLIEVGFTDYISKPIDKELLINLLMKYNK